MIPVGLRHEITVGKWEGDFYAMRTHTDCPGLWLMLRDLAGYEYSEGSDWDIAEMMGYPGTAETQGMLDHCRGFYPHAVNRMEFRLRAYLSEDT